MHVLIISRTVTVCSRRRVSWHGSRWVVSTGWIASRCCHYR